MTLAVENVRVLMGGAPREATIEDVRNSPDFMAGVKRGLKQLNEGKGKSWEEVKAEFGW